MHLYLIHHYQFLNKRVAITHEFLINFGGAEKVLSLLLDMFPEAELYTFVDWHDNFPPEYKLLFNQRKIHTSFFNKFKFFKRFWQIFIPFMPIYFMNLKLNKYDLIISSSASFAKWVEHSENSIHLAYIHTPPRFIWGLANSTLHKFPFFLKPIIDRIISRWRDEDYKFAYKANILVANSGTIRQLIQEFYNLDSRIIYPPAILANHKDELKQFDNDYYVSVNRLVSYKMIDKLIEAFNQNGKKLYIIGKGSEESKLKSLAKDNIKFLGFADEFTKESYIKYAKALIYTGREDFGISMAESLQLGTPIIAYKEGGASEIVNYKNGVLLDNHVPQTIIDCINDFELLTFDKLEIIETGKKYTYSNFRKELLSALEQMNFQQRLQKEI